MTSGDGRQVEQPKQMSAVETPQQSVSPSTRPEALASLSATNAQELLQGLHRISVSERNAQGLFPDRTAVRTAIQAGTNIINILRDDPVTDGEGTPRKLERFGQISDQLLEPKSKAFMTDLYQQMEPIFAKYGIKGGAFVLLGSNSIGGMHIRELTGGARGEENDLDLQFVYESAESSIDFYGLQAEVRIAMARMQEGLPVQYVPDPVANASFMNQQRLTEATAATLLNTPIPDKFRAVTSIVNCFRPSFPPDANKGQQEAILTSLRKLWKDNPTLWQQQVDMILEGWNMIPFVRLKHLTTEHDDNFAGLSTPENEGEFDRVQEGLELIKGDLFRDLLYSTQEAA